ncbi:MAG: hypothetical protein J6Y32_04025 [Bacteroidales bacterium]|nr:hypothetical protein [Bacteroidales bacterium]
MKRILICVMVAAIGIIALHSCGTAKQMALCVIPETICGHTFGESPEKSVEIDRSMNQNVPRPYGLPSVEFGGFYWDRIFLRHNLDKALYQIEFLSRDGGEHQYEEVKSMLQEKYSRYAKYVVPFEGQDSTMTYFGYESGRRTVTLRLVGKIVTLKYYDSLYSYEESQKRKAIKEL